jgi:hypothetical protein
MGSRIRAIVYLVCALVVALSAFRVRASARLAWQDSFRKRTVELAAFCRLALESRMDLLISERFNELTRDNDTQWALIQDANGRVSFSTSAGEIGTTLDSPRAKAASGTTDILVQETSLMGPVEVDVSLGKFGVLRVCGTSSSMKNLETWLGLCGILGALALLAAGWQAFKAAPPAPPPQQQTL